ncbi:rab-GTPase-TBC domain-containing protein [Mycena crocata]|nr:rab-GTPase-TBC domain-containing protein [Mycena crocata]
MSSEKTLTDPSLEDWEEYRRLSLCPGGFGDKRTDIWSKVLHAQPQPELKGLEQSSSHPDERQIRLDTERSFVLYPVDSQTDKDTLQSELHDLLTRIFRKFPKLNYFQGYHDIVTVLLLTCPPELQLPCAEQLSLQRVRDSMGSTLDPVLGLLRVMKNLLRVADPKYAELLERTSPLPYYALPNLLTLFSHDMPTLPLIQHVFDYLLCRPPIFVVYLASAIILSRKPEVERLEEEGEEGMMHSLLSALPEIVDNDNLPKEEITPKEETPPETIPVAGDGIPDIKPETLELSGASEALQRKTGDEHAGELGSNVSINQDADVEVESDLPQNELPTEIKTEMSSEVKRETSSSPSSDASDDESPPTVRKVSKPKSQNLTDILKMSDALYDTHVPPTHPSLQLSSIMGPQSVIFTWSTCLADMPTNDEAECMVQRLDLIVYPEPPVVESDKKKRPRKRLKRRATTGTVGMLVGAGLVLGVAVAVSVYGARQGGDHARDWRRLGRWVGGILTGASERVNRYRL